MTLTKRCATCKQEKPLNEFRLAPVDGRAKIRGTSLNCLDCLRPDAPKIAGSRRTVKMDKRRSAGE